jgi:hypothetical protein
MTTSTLRASSLGNTANRLLRPAAQLRVRGVFRNAIHAIAAQGELLVLTNDSTSAPWVVTIPGLNATWAVPDDLLFVRQDRAYLLAPYGQPIRIDAPIWVPIAIGSPAPLPQIRTILTQVDLPDTAPGLTDTPTALVANLRSALTSENPVALESAIRPLIGLGRGLTPAGDDLLTGMVGVLVLAGHSAIPCNFANRTSLPAATQLMHALRGELPEPLHEVIRWLLLAQMDAANYAIQRLAQLGSSSGRDMLAGVRLGIEALVR